ncbi:MAG: universal stress protein [Anaerolineae bacterium]|nr:universal stress protein [Anaerolineae bacterium]
MFKKILFAHSATPAAERALLYLEHIARVENAEVIVLHVYEPPDRYMATHTYNGLLEQLEKVVHEVVNDAVGQLRDASIITLGIVRAGKPARAILETAQDEDVSLIVLGTRGPSSVTEILLGDVSTEVLRYARCPVFLVP